MTTRRHLLQTMMTTGVMAPLVAEARPRADDPWAEADRIVARIVRPHFPARDFVVTDFGATEGGKTKCTEAFAKAVDACTKAGGGRVVVPEGVWLTGPIHLKSNVNLFVSRDATVRFSTDTADYLPLVLTRWEGVECMNYSPLIYAFEAENIAVTGEGTLDGQASDVYWWPWKGKMNFGWREGTPNQDAARNRLFAMGDANTPVAERLFGEGSYLRPNFFEPYRCKNVLIEGVTLRNAPFWEVHPVLCRSVTVRGLTIDSAGPNTDGCDPESCRDVLIENCSFNTGDDCIAIKSGRNGDGRRVNVPSENIVIRGCRMKDGHGGVTIGSEITGGVHNVFAENCRMDSPDLWNAIRIKNNAMRGGNLGNFHFRNIAVGQVAHAVLTIDFNYEEGGKGAYHPVLKGVHLSSIVSGKSKYGIDAQGLPNAVVEDITLDHCAFDNVSDGVIVKYVRGMKFRGLTINGKPVSAP
ncbi:glycoside hydrolase family 28 protein [Rhizomicrobium electricum]|uniref:Exopolygalacturonase PelB n=1 Tax=Rhizomicrobium electricum TaxID=480070 RepID=A0ABN1EN45_9PROT|nr:glycoside hydrolase family 28 protein [Rhizomicrobium electricum]NIJ46924.1 polygalacturonase [Rhizomicrobium electricum]